MLPIGPGGKKVYLVHLWQILEDAPDGEKLFSNDSQYCQELVPVARVMVAAQFQHALPISQAPNELYL